MKVQTDICKIRTGPIGLFAVFQAGLLKMRCQVVDILPQGDSQLSTRFPQEDTNDLLGNRMFSAFNKKLEELKLFSDNIDQLSIRVIANYGEITRYQFSNFIKLYGQILIEAHRLLKKNSPEYIFIDHRSVY